MTLMLTRTVLTLLLLLPSAVSAQELDKAVSAVVRISGMRDGTPVRGSGFVVGLDRDKATIVTASHVIEGVQQLEVTFAIDRTESFPIGTVLGKEFANQRGLAVFQVRGALPAGMATLSFDTESQILRGEELFLLGFPQRAKAPLALRRTFAGPDGNFLQLDLPAGEGFSGAPVLRKGKVVGVVVDEDTQLTFAVKALVAQDAVIGWGGRLSQTSTPVTRSVPETKPSVAAPKQCVPREESSENGIVFVRICPGTFTMGSAENDKTAGGNEKPAHQVTLSEFWIGKTEISNAQYRRFRSDHKGENNLPATDVSWADAKAACEHFGGHLPTEAEWEYASRAGSPAAWSFGNDEKMLGEYARYGGKSGGKPHPVGTRKANVWGLHDMHGNVWEWVADWYGPYPREAQTDPAGPKTGQFFRSLRGGAFFNSPRYLRSAFRNFIPPSLRGGGIGFRCARSPRRQP